MSEGRAVLVYNQLTDEAWWTTLADANKQCSCNEFIEMISRDDPTYNVLVALANGKDKDRG